MINIADMIGISSTCAFTTAKSVLDAMMAVATFDIPNKQEQILNMEKFNFNIRISWSTWKHRRNV